MKRLSVNEVSEVLLSEKKTAKLTKLDPQWMIRLGDTLVFLGERRREALAEENGTAFEIYDDELRKIKKLRKQILEIREKKIMSLSWSAREDVKPKTKYMLPNEKKLYQLLVDILREWRESLRDRTEFDPELIVDHEPGQFLQSEEAPEDGLPEEDEPEPEEGVEALPVPGEPEESDEPEEPGPVESEPATAPDEPETVPAPEPAVVAESEIPDPAPQAAPEPGPTPEEPEGAPPAQEKESPGEEPAGQETSVEAGGRESPEPEDDEEEEQEREEQKLITIGILSEELSSFLDANGKVYELRKGELAHIPEEEARLLIDNGLAREIGGSQ